MSKRIDLAGQRFGRLVVVEFAGTNRHNIAQWLCNCDCGKTTIVGSCSLRNGNTRSCGCLQKEMRIERNTTHGMYGTLIYRIWGGMVQRCGNRKNTNYEDYGGRGITVCNRWLKFENFFEDMGKRFTPFLTIERINNNEGYYKENCRWATRTEQSRNTRVYKNNKTGIAGVSWSKQCNKYQVYITAKRQRFHLGFFALLQEAVCARIEGELRYWKLHREREHGSSLWAKA